MELVEPSITEFENSVWHQSSKGKWIMNFNNKQQITEENSKFNLDLTNKRPLSIGTLVMTPKGIGKLQKLEENNARVKFLNNEEEENFERVTVSSDFHIYIKILFADSSCWYRITVPSNGTTELIKKSIEDLKMVDLDSFNYVLIYQGKELTDNLTFDQLDFKPNSKILMSGYKMSPFKLCK
jgi:hypothetical protein